MNLGARARVGFRRLAQSVRTAVDQDTKMRRPRLVWFNVKRALRIPTRGDRKFLLYEFGRMLEDGRIGPGCHITVAGRNDGAGSQGLARMSGICLAKRYGLTYVHTPFRGMQVAEGQEPIDPYKADEAWAAAWESVFNLGHGEISAVECTLPRIEIDDFMADRQWWSSPCLLSAGYYSMIVDRMPEAYYAVIPQLRQKFFFNKPPRPRSNVVDVCAHLRRGVDVRPDNPETAYRFVSDDIVLKSIRMTQSVLNELGLSSHIRLFSQGDQKDFAPFRDMGFELCLNTPAIPSFCAMVEADVLIMTKSSFSYAAAILNGGVKLYDRYARSPLPDWIVSDAEGGFDREQFRTRCVAALT
jgi:hypothetical protein